MTRRRPNHHQRRRRSQRAKAQGQTTAQASPARPPTRSPAATPQSTPTAPITNTPITNTQPPHPTYEPPTITHTGSTQDLPTPQPLTAKENIAITGLAIVFILIELTAAILLFQALQ